MILSGLIQSCQNKKQNKNKSRSSPRLVPGKIPLNPILWGLLTSPKPHDLQRKISSATRLNNTLSTHTTRHPNHTFLYIFNKTPARLSVLFDGSIPDGSSALTTDVENPTMSNVCAQSHSTWCDFPSDFGLSFLGFKVDKAGRVAQIILWRIH